MENSQEDTAHAITRATVEVEKAAVQAMPATKSESLEVRSEPTSTGPKLGRSILRQPSFEWGATDK